VTGDAVLRIAGIGPELPRLEHLARALGITSRVEFLRHLPLHELMAEYRNASLFALPSEQEGFGIVFLEAMASCLPVVAVRAGAVPEVVADGETALLVDPGDEPALVNALERLLRDPALRARLGSAGRERVFRFGADFVARKFLNAIGGAAGDPPPSSA
jgi:glycosyltransferase involved in cell wall biosynthesis